jgi:hypothetical protein
MHAGWVLQAYFGVCFWNTKSPDISEPFGDLFMIEGIVSPPSLNDIKSDYLLDLRNLIIK